MFSLSWKRVAPVLVVVAGAFFAAGARAGEDNWRRTAHGWEKADAWLVQPGAGPQQPLAAISTARWDVHPAALVLLQAAVVLAAMLVFPRPNSPLPSWLNEDWQVALRRSFRASIFGS